MSEKVENKIIQYQSHTRDNELDIMSSSQCGCICCGEVFSARDVHLWVEEGNVLSARCPRCGLPYVVSDSSGLPLDRKTLSQLSDYLLDNKKESGIYDEICRFCADYYAGKIDNNDIEMIRLYERYIRLLYREFKDPAAAFALGRIYADGSPLTAADRDKAIAYFEDELLCQDGRSFYEAGLLYLARGERGDNRRAFEAFSKSSALGSLEGSMYIAIFYLHGNYVKADQDFAVNTLLSVFGGLYSRALVERQGYVELIFCAFHIGYCFYEGLGCPQSESRAIRYWLITQYFLDNTVSRMNVKLPWIDEFKNLFSMAMVNKNLANEGPLFDEDTFYDSFFEQQEATTPKLLKYMDYAEDTGSVRFGISSSVPLLIIDAGNFCVTQANDSDWEMTLAKFVRLSDENTFNRFEFIGQYMVRFVLDDPIRGAVAIAELSFEPPVEEEQPKEE